MADSPKHLVRADDLDQAEAVRIRHPFNPNSEVRLTAPGRANRDDAGVGHPRPGPAGQGELRAARAPAERGVRLHPRRQWHRSDRRRRVRGRPRATSWVFRSTVPLIPCATPVLTDLVYLMGGEHVPLEVAHFPTVGRMIVASLQAGIQAFDDATAQQLTLADFIAPE